ncbi:hypothetical protein HP550_19665 [Cellulomonas humilata]|uniref:Uncharacterized protein n=1 Tax=Cellulomonas humilata TaxID=144055 RepID=A0A7Y6A6B0_9CELL|nr:hypothetical protein [Cellulomonas humilata]
MADNMYAGVSVQAFPNGDAALSTPHGDVKAFLDYVRQFSGVNFHAQDDDVREWRFNREYDNWQDSLGMDSVRVLHTYTHMGMAADGRYVAAMGRTWDNTFLAESTRMSFGDQRLRYLMLHGCHSLEMQGGQNPWRTWAEPNKGARMIFGFDGLTYDVGGLGAGFFREWNKGKSFSQSWQDAAFSTLTNHRPSSTACGATADEAQDRLWNERLFHGGAVSDNWYWWRWAGPTVIEVVITITVPPSPMRLSVERRPVDDEAARNLGDRFGLRPWIASAASPDPEHRDDGGDALVGPRLVLSPDGTYEAFLAEPDRYARPIDVDAARDIAERTVRSLELDTELVLDAVTVTEHGGASQDGDQTETAIADFTAHFRQVFDGTPMARGHDGHVSVTLDAGGTVCSVSDRTVSVVGAVEAAPADGYGVDVDEALHRRIADLERQLRCDGRSDSELVLLPDTRDVSYRIDHDSAVLVAREEVEVRSGDFAIRKVVEAVL